MLNTKLLVKMLKTPLHPEGWPYVLGSFVVTGFCFFAEEHLGLLAFIISCWVVYFFRNPQRVIPTQDGAIVSPADGIVSFVGLASPPEEMEISGEFTCVSVFMSIFDVHVNRSPLSGKILKRIHRPGLFLDASSDVSREKNERLSLLLESDKGTALVCTQVAGLIARRIVCNAAERLERGQVYGIIRFGSRLDLYFPSTLKPLVTEGQRMIAGETVIAYEI